MRWFGVFQYLLLYSQTVKWDWIELVQDRATIKCVGKMHWFGIFQNVLVYSQTVKCDWTEQAQDRQQ